MSYLFFSLVCFSMLSSSYVYRELCVSPALRQKEERCFPAPENTRYELRSLQKQVCLQSFKGKWEREQQFPTVYSIFKS